jgi:hypothetical protein
MPVQFLVVIKAFVPILHNVMYMYVIYRIAENFCGVQFSRFSRISYHPRKLDP